LHKTLLLSINALCASPVWAQSPAQAKLSVHWEELSAAEFRDAVARAQGTCLLPFGILEKHGLHLPLGNDLLNVRYVALNAAQQEYAIVFPEYYFGQIFEAKHQPGTVAYSRRLQLELLQETTDEMARNGCKKIIIVNGHGGNNSLLPFFAQAQLEAPHDYVVYVLGITRSGQGEPKHKSNPATDLHAGESETGIRCRSGALEAAGRAVHRHLVVRPFPQSLCRRRCRGVARAGRVRGEDVDQRYRAGDPRRQSGPGEPALTKRVLRAGQASAGNAAVGPRSALPTKTASHRLAALSGRPA
jgi:creatinine amidohydrolase/Fe(II)-dependent formamide hydrolase-like protein